MDVTHLACACGNVSLTLRGGPIITTECHCNSCRKAAAHFEALAEVPRFRSANGGTPFVMMRKDRVEIASGAENLTAYRLDGSPTRRVLASCCNTPVFLEFQGGHWLSIYASMWPQSAAPEIQLRTMTSDLENPKSLDDAVPSGTRQTFGFYARLLGAWIAMGFRSPKVPVAHEVVLR